MGAPEGTQVRRRLRLVISSLFTLFILALAAFALLNYVFLPRLVRLGDERVVPDVRTLPSEEARTVLRLSGLNDGEVRKTPHFTLPEGYVVDLVPKQGMRVKAGRDVVITVSSGPRWAEVPNLFRTTVKISEITLRECGLELGQVREEYSDTVPEGLVISSDPGFGAQLQWGDTVDVVVSLGRRLITVPDLRGMTVREAQEVLRDLGLVLDTGLIPDPGLRIEAQSPPPGRKVASGSEISVQVGSP